MPRDFHVTLADRFVRYRPASARGPLPTVVHVPGFNEDAASPAPFALRLAEAGMQGIVLDPPWRTTPNLENPSPAVLFALFDEVDARLDTVLGDLLDGGGSDATRLALTGFSMGGLYVSRRLAARSHPFDAAALVLATGDWSFMPRTTLDALPHLKAVIPDEAVARIEQVLRAQSPVATPERFPPTALLLLNADRDPRVPLDAARRFHDALRPAYAARGADDALVFRVHPGQRHEFRRAMQREVRDWLRARWGLPPAPMGLD